jgi:hypothetical protein
MVGRMERQTASSSASCSSSSSSSSVCGGKKRPDILNMIRVRLNLLSLLLAPVLHLSGWILFYFHASCRPDVDPAKENWANPSVRGTLLWIKSFGSARLAPVQTTPRHGRVCLVQLCKGEYRELEKKGWFLIVYSFYREDVNKSI